MSGDEQQQLEIGLATARSDAQLAIAAHSYVIARERLAGATGAEVAVYAVELDDALHTLTTVAGYPCDGCDCDECNALRDPIVEDTPPL